jgi:hypothetical protein
MEITTNNIPRPILDAHELTPKEREEFDYLDWDKLEAGEDSASFFRYKGEVHYLGDFAVWDNLLSPLNKQNYGRSWDGFMPETFFSGIIVKYVEIDNEWSVIVGRYCA